MGGIIKQNREFLGGYNEITGMNGKHGDMLMDFGIIKLGKNAKYSNEEMLERAFLLIYGEAELQWQGVKQKIKRTNCFDESPWCLHVPKGVAVEIVGLSGDSEFAYMATDNEQIFSCKLYEQSECRSEERGAGTMKETSTRTVRTIFDYSNAPYANLVVGEVIGHPGKWSSYPSHHHPQPEVYFYKFFPENGFGFSELGEQALKLRHNDTVKISAGETHAQTTAPGHAMYYLWVIRHIEGNPYITPEFLPEYKWLMDREAIIWPDKA